MNRVTYVVLSTFYLWHCLLVAATETGKVQVCLLDNICADIPQEVVADLSDKIIIYFYTGKSPYEYVTYTLSRITQVLEHPYYDLLKHTMVYLHGFTETPWKLSVLTVVSAYLQRGEHNVLVVDWSEVCNRTYREAAVLAPLAGRHVAQGLDEMARAGQPLARVHVVGHSLGGQCAGHVGKNVATGKLPRITALDPARPLFESVGTSHLAGDDADIVDVIHTDGGFYGILGATGTIDFFPNGGSRYQPGCAATPSPFGDTGYIPAIPSSNDSVKQDLCSHVASWKYYAISVLNETAFPAVPCFSWVQFMFGLCPMTPDNVVYMGYPDPKEARGIYYLTARTS